ncbi:MAG: DNA mismatch repair endonuclease MutL [Phycisphaerales bacterium]|nr:DNA mismatch repair endonuclease MutL [Phycisphaerales bacterium]
MGKTSTQSQVTIRTLSTLLVNQIAAGEVIERPASVLKELVENSIDAGATRIEVDLERGGVEQVRVSDNGHGIAPDQISLALMPHATSKIYEADDLNKISTMGFRGEALASIASVSRVMIRSKANGFDEGRMIEAEGADVQPIKPAGGAVGTTIEVRNLFFNTPARRKFLRTDTTEQTRCVGWLRDLAMAHPSIAFRCVGDGKVKLDLPPDQLPKERALAIMGKELESELIEVSLDQFDDARGILMWGLIGLPSIARATSNAQHVFLNGRTIRDRTIQHALREAFRGLIEPGKHPSAVLMLEMSPTAVDVNVHPAKLEVRFRDQSMIHRAVYHTVREALMNADVTPTVLQRLPGAGTSDAIMPAAMPQHRVEKQVDQIVEYLKAKSSDPQEGASPPEQLRNEIREVLIASIEIDESSLPTVVPVQKVLQVHSSFLVSQDPHGIIIVDQHALHERVMFNTLIARVTGNGSLEQQAMLMPIVVDAPASVVDSFDAYQDLLTRIGIDAAPMGPKSIGVRSAPSFLLSRNVEPGEFVEDLLERIDREGFVPSSEEALHEVLDMMACKAAIKAGDRLSEVELDAIMKLREETDRAGSCPHGRPTTVRLTIEELEKLFDRR